MDFLFYLLVVFLAIISSSFICIILTTLRVGLSFCNDISKSTYYEEYEKISASRLKNKYYISLIIDIVIVIIITCAIVFLLQKYSIVYWTIIVLSILMSLNKTGKNNPNNIQEFYNSLQCNYPYDDCSQNGNKKIVNELMQRSNLSQQICSDIYYILLDFKSNNKDNAYVKINSTLIPHLKEESNVYNAGVAFGMLIDNEYGLTEEEANNYSNIVIKQILTKE